MLMTFPITFPCGQNVLKRQKDRTCVAIKTKRRRGAGKQKRKRNKFRVAAPSVADDGRNQEVANRYLILIRFDSNRPFISAANYLASSRISINGTSTFPRIHYKRHNSGDAPSNISFTHAQPSKIALNCLKLPPNVSRTIYCERTYIMIDVK